MVSAGPTPEYGVCIHGAAFHVGRIRYIGSKARIVDQILDAAGAPTSGRFVDVFCGTGTVSRAAAIAGWKVLANDHLLSASVATHAQLLDRAKVSFERLGGYQTAIDQLNGLRPRKGFFFREYSPSGRSRTGETRQYFTVDNASRIDAIRTAIEHWHDEDLLNLHEYRLLLTDLMEAANRVANIAGTYGCFLRRWTAGSDRPLVLTPRHFLPHSVPFEVSTLDAFELNASPADLVYMDPPYTKRQYASYYHILETIAHGDEPRVVGVSGLRPWESKASLFCYKRKALPALLLLCSRLKAHRFLISYNSQGHIPIKDMTQGLQDIGKVTVHELAVIGRYRPNVAATGNGSSVTEYLVDVSRAPVAPTTMNVRPPRVTTSLRKARCEVST